MKLALTALVAASLVPKALQGTWDAVADGQHVASVHVDGNRASFADGPPFDSDAYQYTIRQKQGLLEMSGWVARADSNPNAILWHKDNEEVMWRRQVPPSKLRGKKALEQSSSGLRRTTLPEENATASPLDRLLAASAEARHQTASLHAEPDAQASLHAEPDAQANTTQPDRALSQADTQATTAATEATTKAVVHKKVVRQVKKVTARALSQVVMNKYIVPLKVAQEAEQTEEKAEKKNRTKAHKKERRKLFPAAMHSLAALMTNTQRGIDADVFDDVIETVRGIIRDEAMATTTDIEGAVQAIVDTMVSCSTDFGYASGATGTSEAYDSEDSKYTTAVGEYDTAYAAENTTCTEKNTVCGNRDAKGLELYNEVTGSSSCGLPAAVEDSVTYDDNFVLADVDGWANTLLSKHTAWDTAKVECTTKTQDCSDAETVTATAESEKSARCTALSGAAADGAAGYDGCWDSNAGAYTGYDGDTAINSIKNSIEAVETLMCYIDVAMEGLAAENADDRTADTDASTACTFDDATETYDCVCSSGSGEERYTESYALFVAYADPPDKDASWDDLGCPEAGDGDSECEMVCLMCEDGSDQGGVTLSNIDDSLVCTERCSAGGTCGRSEPEHLVGTDCTPCAGGLPSNFVHSKSKHGRQTVHKKQH